MSRAEDGKTVLNTVRRLALLGAPFGIAVAIILSIYIESGSPLEGTYRAAAVALVLTLGLEALLIPVIGLELAAAATALMVIATFKQVELGAAALALTAIAILSSWLRRRRLPSRSTFARGLRIGVALLLAATIGRGVTENALGLPAIHAASRAVEPVDGPDVVIVLLDGYPRADTLVTHFGLDNSPFLSDLEERGFDVSRRSRSNYALTALTLASMFEMRHVSDIPSLAHETRYAEGYRAVSRLLSRPLPAVEIFRQHAYEAVAIPAVVNEFRLRAVDTDLDSGEMVQLETVILGKTLIAPVVNGLAPELIHQQQRDRSLSAIAAIEALAADPRQQFVFAHLMLPHSPFVFGRDGEPIPQPGCVPTCSIFEGPSDKSEWVRQYGEQLIYTNELLLEMVDFLLASADPPVVVLMSDHGARAWREEDPDEMLRNFFAAYTPGAPGLFPNDATPINVFPRLIGEYLDERVSLLPERFFLPDGYGPLIIRRVH